MLLQSIQVYATDRDAGDNGKVEYFIIDDPSGFFAINHYTGWITVARPMAGVRQPHTFSSTLNFLFSLVLVSLRPFSKDVARLEFKRRQSGQVKRRRHVS